MLEMNGRLPVHVFLQHHHQIRLLQMLLLIISVVIHTDLKDHPYCPIRHLLQPHFIPTSIQHQRLQGLYCPHQLEETNRSPP